MKQDERQKRVFSFTDSNKGEEKRHKHKAERRELEFTSNGVISLRGKNMGSKENKDEIWICEEQKRFKSHYRKHSILISDK